MIKQLLILGGLVGAFAVAQSIPTGVIDGSVVDDSGAPISGVFVTAVQQSKSGPPVTVNGVSDDSGNYELGNVPDGTYTMCAQLESAGVLNPCVWSEKQATATVADGGKASGVSIVMVRGAMVNIRLNDVKQALAANASKDDILIGTANGPSPFIAASVTSKDAAGRTHSLLLPPGQPIRVTLFSSAFTFSDDSGRALPAAAGGGNSSVITVTATKGKPTTVTIQLAAKSEVAP